MSWLYVSQPDPDHAGQRRAGELPAPEQAIWSTTRKPGSCHLSSITVKMILVACKIDVHSASGSPGVIVSAPAYADENVGPSSWGRT